MYLAIKTVWSDLIKIKFDPAEDTWIHLLLKPILLHCENIILNEVAILLANSYFTENLAR
jgi:hypothetical protein